MVFNLINKHPVYAWSYSSLCKSFKKYTAVIIPMVGDENTELYDDEIELKIEEFIINK